MDLIELREPESLLPGISANRVMGIFSAAEAGDVADLFTLYRDVMATDSHIANEFTKRKAAVLGDRVNVRAWNAKDPVDIEAATFCGELTETQTFTDLQSWLLNATLWPVAVAEKVFAAKGGGFVLTGIVPVPYQLIDYRSGRLQILAADPDTHLPLPASGVDPDPDRYIIHRGHTLPVPDYWGGPFRGILFWWLLRTMSRQWWAQFVERFGQPFFKGRYGDSDGRNILHQAFAMANRLGGIAISKATEVEIVQTAMADSSNSHQQFIQLCNDEISRAIVGQTLSSSAAPTGELGGGTAALQGDVREDLRRMDARRLAQTVRAQLFAQYMRINGMIGNASRLAFGSETDTAMKTKIGMIGDLFTAGLEPTDDGIASLSEETGISLQRKAVPAAAPTGMPFAAMPLAAGAVDPAPRAEDGVAALADAFTGRYAPLRAIILAAPTRADCDRRVRDWIATIKPSAAGDVIEHALAAWAENGAKSVKKGVIKKRGQS